MTNASESLLKKRLVLIDGSSYLYRAFHALPPLTNDAGEPTGALFGVVNMLRATLKEQPDYVAFVVDAPGKTFRDDLYPEYKANRAAMPDDLRAQVLPMCEIVEALGITILRESGVEADDVIGTLAVDAAGKGIDVTISTGDKDFAQLVRPGIALVNTMSGSRMDSEATVVDKFGVRPDQIVDFLALMGDSIDNVPGVEKCGPKTAAKWLGQYGTLDEVIARAGEVTGKIGENLRAALPRLPLNRTLVTIKTDLALERAPTDLVLRSRHVEDLRALYARYGFKQALRELEGGAAASDNDDRQGGSMRSTAAGYARAGAAPAAPVDAALSAPGEYETVLTQERFDAWLARLQAADEFAFDTETDSLDPMQARIIGLSFAAEPGKAAYLPLAHDYPGAPAQLDREQALAALRPLFVDPSKKKLGQHGKYDLHVLRRHGIKVAGYADDTMLESFVLNATATRHDMDSLAKRYLGYETVKYEQVAGKGARQIPFSQVALDDATRYAAEDADVTYRLHRVLAPRLAAEPALEKVYREIEMPLVQVLERIEATGVMIDAGELRRQSADLGKRMLAAQQKATEAAACDPRVSRVVQAAQHLHRQAAGNGQSLHRPRAHQLPPGRRRDRPPGLQRSEPAEHPDPHRRRPPHPPGFRRPAGAQDRRLRLLADRAAHHGPPVRRRRPAARIRVRRRHPPRHGRRSVRQEVARRGQRQRTPRRQGDQLRPDVRHGRVRPGAPARHRARRGAGLHRAVLQSLSGRARFHGAHAPASARTGLCRDRVRSSPVP
jgi:DNA polymerase-1